MPKKRFLQALAVIVILLFAMGCTIDFSDKKEKKKSITKQEKKEDAKKIECREPQVLIDDECCLDEDENDVCDKYELEAFCGDDVCSYSESECTCPEDCGGCDEKPAGICKFFQCIDDECVESLKDVCCGDDICDEMYEACGTCFQDCCSLSKILNQEKTGLENYPEVFEGISTVLGNKAPPEDVVIAGDILTHMASENLSVGKGLLSSEITLGSKDYIIVGNPCDNPAAFELWKNEIMNNDDDCQIFEPGEGVVKIFPVSTYNVVIYVGGHSPYETERASKILIDHETKNPKGSETWI